MSRSKRNNQNREEHPIEMMVRSQNKWIREFSQNHPDVWGVIGSNINFAQMLQSVIGQQPNLSMIEVHRHVMWQTVFDYQVQSIILILQHKLDAGLALLRMAAELSRDVYSIGNNQTKLDLWMEKNDKNREYRDSFKFDQTLPQAKMVFDIYKLCSAFGVHGHVSNNMNSRLIGRAGRDDELALLDVSDIGILDSVGTWLMGFAPMHHLCAKEFLLSRLPNMPEVFTLMQEFETSSTELAKSFDDSLKNLKQQNPE